MKLFKKKSASNSPRYPGSVETNKRSTPKEVGCMPNESIQDEHCVDVFHTFDPTVRGRVEILRTGKYVLLPNMGDSDCTMTQALLTVLSQTTSNLSETIGYDPYDTVELHEKQGEKKG